MRKDDNLNAAKFDPPQRQGMPVEVLRRPLIVSTCQLSQLSAREGKKRVPTAAAGRQDAGPRATSEPAPYGPNNWLMPSMVGLPAR